MPMENDTAAATKLGNATLENIVNFCVWTYMVRNPSKSFVTNSLVLCVANVITSLLGIGLNLLIVIVLCKSKKLQDKVTYFLITILSITDLGVGALVCPLFIVGLASEISGNPRCSYRDAHHLLAFALSGMSVVTHFIINAERYLSTVHPTRHRNSVTKNKCFLAIILLWMIPLILGFLQKLHQSVIVACAMSIMLLGTVFMYISIFVTVRKVLRRRVKIDNEQDSTRKNTDETRDKILFQRQLKLTKTCLLIVLTCFVCYIPLIIVFTVWKGQKRLSDARIHARRSAALILTLNSTINSLVLLWGNAVLRKKTKKVIQKSLNMLTAPCH